MAKTTVELEDGLKIGDQVEKGVELREATAGDIIDGTAEAERAVPTPQGYQLVASPTLAGVHSLRRQIVRIGGFDGVVSLQMIKKLSPRDLEKLQEAAADLEQASLAGVTERGREDPSSKSD